MKQGKELKQKKGVTKVISGVRLVEGGWRVVCKSPEVQVCLAYQEAIVTKAEETGGGSRS